jgi:hypothetical protein
LKNRVAKTIVPRKRINCAGDPEDSMGTSFFTCPSLPWKKIFKMKAPDKIMRSIPRNRGNIPVPAIRKVPMGILKESRVVIAPKRKITIPTTISSLFNLLPPFLFLP